MNNIIIYVVITLLCVVAFCIIGSMLHKRVEVLSKEYAKLMTKNNAKSEKLDAHTKAVLVAAISGYFNK